MDESRKAASLSLLEAIGRDEDITDKLEEAEDLSNWISKAQNSGYRIGLHEWLTVIKEAIQEHNLYAHSKEKPIEGRIYAKTQDSDKVKGLKVILEKNPKLLGQENLTLIK